MPAVDDLVVGVVIEKHTETYRIDIGTTHVRGVCFRPAMLNRACWCSPLVCRRLRLREPPSATSPTFLCVAACVRVPLSIRCSCVQVGALVYARVISCNKHMDTELSCISPHFKKEWVTGQSLFGELAGGYKFDCSLRLARR